MPNDAKKGDAGSLAVLGDSPPLKQQHSIKPSVGIKTNGKRQGITQLPALAGLRLKDWRKV
jgi:hypothetical protein